MNKVQKFFSGLVNIGQKKQGIKSSDWWKEGSLNQEQIFRLFKIIAKFDCHDSLYWTEVDNKFHFFINCNDLFFWGCGDCEDISSEKDVDLLEKSLQDTEDYGSILYVTRKRKMRPQGAYYQYINKEYWRLFDDCGPKREATFGNPYERPDEKDCNPVPEKYKEDIRDLHYRMMKGQKIEKRFRYVESEDFEGKTYSNEFSDWQEFNYIKDIEFGILELRYKVGDKYKEIKR